MRFSFRSTSLVAAIGLLGILMFGGTARVAAAQDSACVQVMDLADRYYEQNRMQEVIALVADCLNDESTDVPTSVRGYRLLALAYLKTDNLPDAKLAIIELLGKSPTYEPDPIQDLPAYTALVNNIKVQLALQGNTDPIEEPSVDPPAPAEPEQTEQPETEYRPQDRILLGEDTSTGVPMVLRFDIGYGSYGGERGDSGQGFFDEFADNGGIALGAELGFVLSEYIVVGLEYGLGHYETMLAPKGTTPTFPVIRIGDSSPWLHKIGLFGRGYVPTGGSVRPYGQISYLATLGLLNDKVSVGSGPQFSAGVDIGIDDRFGIYLQLDGHFVFPGTAVDLVDRDFGYDLFTSGGVGLRYRTSN